jgi:hypothetical protein
MRAKRESVVADIRELTRFPPQSRPLDSSMTDLLRPRSRYDTPVLLPPLKGREAAPQEFALLTASTYDIGEDGVVTLTLTATRGTPPAGAASPSPQPHPPGGEPLSTEIVGVAIWAAGGGPHDASSLFHFVDDGTGGDVRASDGVSTATVDAGTLRAWAPEGGALRVSVRVRVGEREPLDLSADFLVAGDRGARFDGSVSERLVGGSVVYSVGLDVRRPGTYYVSGLVFDASEQPVGYATWQKPLSAGRATAELTFVGLLFHDKNAKAPFVLRTVTGKRLADAGEKHDVPLASLGGEYPSRRYALSELSTEEWQSPERAAQLRAAEELRASAAPLVEHKAPTVRVVVE